MKGFVPLSVDRVRPQTADAVAIRFLVPNDLREAFRFVPGQYLTLRATIDGEEVRRSYSICAAEHEAPEVGIKRVPDGRFSSWALSLRPGDTVEAMAPEGRFTAAIDGGRHDYLLVAAGSGITPCLSIARSVLAGEPDSTVTLIYGNRTTDTVMFREEIDALKDRHTNRFVLFHVTSRERQDVAFLHGRVDGARVRELAERGLVDPSRFDAAYLCGPQGMVESVREALVALGMDETAVRAELFTAAGAPPRPAPEEIERVEGARVTIVADGVTRDVPIDPQTQTVLQAGQAAGLDLPFSCAGGMCCTCRAKVAEGEVAMDANYSLEPWEVEAGFALACQARPRTERTVMDFDAA